MIRLSNASAASPSLFEKYRQATATRTALYVSPALPAAVKKRARRLPGSLYSASPMFNAIELAARVIWSASDRSFALMRGNHRTKSLNQLQAQLTNLQCHVVCFLSARSIAGVISPRAAREARGGAVQAASEAITGEAGLAWTAASTLAESRQPERRGDRDRDREPRFARGS